VTRPSAARIGAVACAALAVALLVVGIVKLADDGGGSGNGGGGGTPSTSGDATRTGVDAAVRAAVPASAPFADLTRTRVTVGGRTLDVVIADSETERETGLRRRRDLGSYDGMLFVFPSPSTTDFTMSTVPVPLDIGFYAASGAVVDRLRMRPCTGTDTSCPVYRAKGPFSYALETLAGHLPRGTLAGVAGEG
jgi:uncharacterized membrane protein (UPF0127 family)